MKLQYRVVEDAGLSYMVKLYCDGNLIESYRVYQHEVWDKTDSLEEQGYKRGYTRSEVNEAEARYRKMLDNIIERKDFK